MPDEVAACLVSISCWPRLVSGFRCLAEKRTTCSDEVHQKPYHSVSKGSMIEFRPVKKKLLPPFHNVRRIYVMSTLYQRVLRWNSSQTTIILGTISSELVEGVENQLGITAYTHQDNLSSSVPCSGSRVQTRIGGCQRGRTLRACVVPTPCSTHASVAWLILG